MDSDFYVCGLDINVLPGNMARFFSKTSGDLTLCKWCTDSHAITAGMSYLLFPANDSGSILWKSGVMDTVTRQLFMTNMNLVMIWSTLIECRNNKNGSGHLNTVWGVYTSMIFLCITITQILVFCVVVRFTIVLLKCYLLLESGDVYFNKFKLCISVSWRLN